MIKATEYKSLIFGEQIMKRNNKLLIAAVAAALSAGMYTSAVSAATISANAAATVIAPLTVVENGGGMNYDNCHMIVMSYLNITDNKAFQSGGKNWIVCLWPSIIFYFHGHPPKLLYLLRS